MNKLGVIILALLGIYNLILGDVINIVLILVLLLMEAKDV